jgi:2-methylcitrate dehydratase
MPDQQPSTKIEQLANWAARANYGELSDQSVEQLPVHVLDCLGCCLASLGATPIGALRSVIDAMGGSGDCLLAGGGSANLMYSALWHTALVRYVDFMDNFLAARETCHTADNFGAVLAAASYAGATGKEMMAALAVGYTAQSRFVDHGTFMERGLDHTAQLGFSIGAAIGPMLGLTAAQTAHGIAMAAANTGSYDNIRAKPLSQWKGLASSQAAFATVNAMLLAKAGVTGPLFLIEGSGGLEKLLGAPIDIDWAKQGYEGITISSIKKYNSEIHTQSAIECMIELRAKRRLDPAKIASIEAHVTQITYDFAGGGSYGDSTVGINTKEQADHSLQYLVAVALIDGAVGPAQFDPARIARDDVQHMLRKVQATPDDAFTRAYPTHMPARMVVTMNDGQRLTHQVQDYPGMPIRPFSWDQSVDKFMTLTDQRVDAVLRGEIIDAVKGLASNSAYDLMMLLNRVRPPQSV